MAPSPNHKQQVQEKAGFEVKLDGIGNQYLDVIDDRVGFSKKRPTLLSLLTVHNYTVVVATLALRDATKRNPSAT